MYSSIGSNGCGGNGSHSYGTRGNKIAKNLGLEKTIFEGDLMQKIQAIEAKEVRSVVGHIVRGILQNLPRFQEARVRHIGRDGNKIAHELAQFAKQSAEEHVWTSIIPDWIEDMARFEGTS